MTNDKSLLSSRLGTKSRQRKLSEVRLNDSWKEPYCENSSISKTEPIKSSCSKIFEIKPFINTEYLTIEDLAKKLKMSNKFIYEQLYSKKLLGQKIGRSWRIEIKEIEKWLALQQTGG